jgi:ABC-type multidrug transport system fused ATPase/permease subunit
MMGVLSRILWLLTQAERRKAWYLLLLMFVGMLLETVSIGLVVPLIGLMMQNDVAIKYPAVAPIFAYFNNPSQTQIIVGAMTFLVFVYLMKSGFLAFSIWKQTSFAYKLQQRISEQLFKSYLNQPYTFHLYRNSADLIRNVTAEVTLFTLVINALLLLITEVMVLMGIAAILVYIEPVGAVVVVSVLVVAGLFFNRFTRNRVLHWGKARQYHDGLRIQHLQQGLGGVKEVKLYGRENDFLKQFSSHNYESARTNGNQVMVQQFPRLGLEFLAIFGLAILVFIMAFNGVELITILPTLGLFAAAAFRLMPSANRLLGALQTLRFHSPVIDVLSKELSASIASDNISTLPARVETKQFEHEIQLKQVSYTYTGANVKALSNISLTIEKGETVGVIGASGSGKSTLIDILLGLLHTSEGSLLVDGHELGRDVKAWQRQIGYVPQSIYLTDDTLKSNVAFGLPKDSIDDASVLRAIEASQLTDFINQLPEGIETMVGERGVRLSGGQRQRIGIARALYHNPDVLVLDEATSALDSDTEHDVMQAIYALHKSKTIIIVAHRLSTVERCDKLFQLEMGKLVATGLPKDVLNKPLVYAPLLNVEENQN